MNRLKTHFNAALQNPFTWGLVLLSLFFWNQQRVAPQRLREENRELRADFERLKGMSYRWGSPEWLQMRRALSAAGGKKGTAIGTQRALYKTLLATDLIWQF